MTAKSKKRKDAASTTTVVRTLAALIVALVPLGALACGLPLGARIPSEQALLSFANGRQEIITSVQLEAAQPGAAVIFPVPSAPEVSALASSELFDYLAEVTQPVVQTNEMVLAPGAAPPAGARGDVQVLGREQLGGYDVARLQAGDASALQAWLDQNGYTVPAGAGPILKSYIDEGWKFVAVKLAANHPPDGQLAPLRLAFDTPQMIYPMRLGALADRPLDLLLYVAGDHRAEIAQLATEYAGPIAALDRPPPAALAPLLRGRYLTKLRNSALAPAALREDFVIGQAPSDAPERKVETRTVYVTGAASLPLSRTTTGAVIGIGLVFLANAVVLVYALVLRKRIIAIAGPNPEKDD